MHPDIRPAEDFTPTTKGRISPAERYVAEINAEPETKDKYYTIREVSEIVGIHIETLRKALRDDKKPIKPTDVLTKGDWHVWLLTDEDLIEVAIYFGSLRRAKAHLESKFGSRMPRPLREKLKESSP